MERVLENIIDPNTKATGKRKITIALELVPSADRKTVTVHTVAKSTLCPTEPITTSLYIGTQPQTGEMVVTEMTPQVPGQYALDGSMQEPPKVLRMPGQKGNKITAIG